MKVFVSVLLLVFVSICAGLFLRTYTVVELERGGEWAILKHKTADVCNQSSCDVFTEDERRELIMRNIMLWEQHKRGRQL